MNNHVNMQRHQSHSGFILINGSTKQEQPVKWEWLTQRGFRAQPQLKIQTQYPRISYSQKKSILTDLRSKPKKVSCFTLTGGFNRNQIIRTVSAANSKSATNDKKAKSYVYINSSQIETKSSSAAFGVNQQQLYKRMQDAKNNNKKILALITIRRMGLRYKASHFFVQYCVCNKNNHSSHGLKEITNQVKTQIKQFSIFEKELYYFHLNGVPIHRYQELTKGHLYVLLVDTSPKLHFNFDLYDKIIELATSIEKAVLKFDSQLKNDDKQQNDYDDNGEIQEGIYDWQRIKDAKQYARNLADNPNFRLSQRKERPSEFTKWYNQKFTYQTNQNNTQNDNNKNPLFQSLNHYPNEILNRKLLAEANDKVQGLPFTVNRHKFIPQRIELMMENVRRQEQNKFGTKQIKTNKRIGTQSSLSKKDMLAYLDKKNTLLSTQNIPYLIQKYGLNRFQIYNLYNLYKSFEKVALMRNPNSNNLQQIKTKGIDRQTFQVGLKGLDMNPGEQLIKNICHFGDFISWEQFIKIISISLRKTPQQKLSAILKGISSFDDGYLTQHQISLMIGNSLQKIFDKPVPELNQYFANMAMRQFDEQGLGKVSVEVLKAKVLGKGSNNLNMVSFLILNT